MVVVASNVCPTQNCAAKKRIGKHGCLSEDYLDELRSMIRSSCDDIWKVVQARAQENVQLSRNVSNSGNRFKRRKQQLKSSPDSQERKN
ncbi:MAG: hypothetical protein ACHBN1_38115 [Heteroscytonema crispum UTEX LB 1556]